MTESTAALTAAVVGDGGLGVQVWFADGATATFNRFWLRDNCPSNGDRESLFRPFSVASMSDDLCVTSAAAKADVLVVAFNDGTTERFPAAVLAPFSETPAVVAHLGDRRPCTDGPTEIAFDPDLAGSPGHHALIDAVCRDGFALVTGVPGDGTEVVASWLGPIRETDFGRVFDIISEPDPFTPSQSSAELDPHTDDPYRYAPPGISILHCVSPCDGGGGETTIVDGFAVADALADEAPWAHETLRTVPVPYVHRRDSDVEQGAAVHLRAEAPIISVDHAGRVCGVRFHERSMAPLRLDPDTTDDVYRALIVFSRMVNSDRFSFRRRLAAGEAVVYDNHRVLHGRNAITGSRGRRHLRLCTIDRDQVHSRRRQLGETYEPGVALQPLAAGSAS